MKIKIVKTEWTEAYVNEGLLTYDKIYDVLRSYGNFAMIESDTGKELPIFVEEFEIVKEEINDKV